MFRNRNISTDSIFVYHVVERYAKIREKKMFSTSNRQSYVECKQFENGIHRYICELNPINMMSITDFNIIILNALRNPFNIEKKASRFSSLITSLESTHTPGYHLVQRKSLLSSIYRITRHESSSFAHRIPSHTVPTLHSAHSQYLYDDMKLVNCAGACKGIFPISHFTFHIFPLSQFVFIRCCVNAINLTLLCFSTKSSTMIYILT